jgi:prepilin signal peptidase PulO-like enzyme (type II secretory pathway)
MNMALPVVTALLLGAALGSFLNVALSRLPRGESIVWPASHCEGCQRPLSWWENVPVVSFLALRGHCRTCHAPIGVRTLVVEAAVGLAAAAAVWSWERSARG